MEKLIELAKKELQAIEEKGVLNTSNLEVVSKLAEITKDLSELEEKDKEKKSQGG